MKARSKLPPYDYIANKPDKELKEEEVVGPFIRFIPGEMLYYGTFHKSTGKCHGKGIQINLKRGKMIEAWFLGSDTLVGHRRIISPKAFKEGMFTN
jgi:hypothetical protein